MKRRPAGYPARMARIEDAAVAATGSWLDPDGFRMPAGEVHAWMPHTNQTLCGYPLHRTRLNRFSHVQWLDVQPATGRDADRVVAVCPRCTAAVGTRRDTKPWRRTDPRP